MKVITMSSANKPWQQQLQRDLYDRDMDLNALEKKMASKSDKVSQVCLCVAVIQALYLPSASP